MDSVPTRYVDRDGVSLAYQVVGSGPNDAVFAIEISGHLDLLWTDPHCHAQLERIAKFSRTVLMQRRGIGLSDPVPYVPTIEQQADDILAVMDAVGMRRATLMGSFSTCAAIALVAARNPERVSNLLLIQPIPVGALADTALDHGWPPEQIQDLVDLTYSVFDQWGSGSSVALWDRGQDTGYNRRLSGMLERCSATPTTARAYCDWLIRMDFADVFKAVTVPTRILRVPLNLLPEPVIHEVNTLIPHAEFVELPETVVGTALGEAWQPIFDHMLELVNEEFAATEPDRFLGTVLFTDVVQSTELLSRVGDAHYRELRERHERTVRLEVDRHHGRLVSVTGDGTFSVFDGPSRAVHCADVICTAAEADGLAVRAGVHTGELEHTAGHDVTGMGVHIGARVAAVAGAGDVVVSRTVRDLTLGSGLVYEDFGVQQLKGLPGEWELYALSHAPAARVGDAASAPAPTVLDRAALRMAQRAPRLARTAVAAGNAWQRRRAKVG
ncbi:MAG TPA: adenylate/guanylate cyclase domain-containing protein [Jatrophihabitantaceae bacterium]|nr:adenylate/guanylate cyclase domain-containing protein [Jatrophihabitantaceae bacterium]